MKKCIKICFFIALTIGLLFVINTNKVHANIIEIGEAGKNITWELDDLGTLTLYGTGNMRNYESYDNHWCDGGDIEHYAYHIHKVVISEGITNIGNYVFEECINLSDIVIPQSVTNIGEHAFDDCGKLKKLTIPSNVTKIGKYAFANCTELENIELPNSITYIDQGAFYNCQRLTSIALPKDIESIEFGLFDNCEKLSSINIPSKVTEIGSYAFASCPGLKNIKLPNNVNTIDEYAFVGCWNLEYVTIPNKKIQIEDNAFRDCEQVTLMCHQGSNAHIFAQENGLNFVAAPRSVSQITVKVATSDKEYRTTPITRYIEIKDYGTTLVEGTDYTVTHKNNTNPGIATITITGKGNYANIIKIERTFKIVKQDLANIKANVAVTDKEYRAKPIKRCMNLYNNGEKLVEGTDYKVSYVNNIDAGTATIIITGKGNYYTGSITKTFKILKQDIANVKANVAVTDKEYRAKPITRCMNLTFNGTKLEEGIDYTVSYKDNINSGTATIIITGKGNFTGSITRTFKILKQSLSNVTASIANSDKPYTTKPITRYIKLKNNGTVLEEGTDYIVTYKNNVNPGTATITITGKGNYYGTITSKFKIVKQNISNVTARIANSWKEYTGKPITRYIELRNNGTLLEEGKDYSVEYANNIECGIATIFITGMGNYYGTITSEFSILPPPPLE